MRYLITGHTGFKGTWLALWLSEAGHSVSGLALNPIPGALFERISMHRRIAQDARVDIRDLDTTREVVRAVRPDVVIHMAAQPLVRDSYRSPRSTVETNVLGTMNVLDAAATTSSVRAQLVVTTDKVYRNIGQLEGYIESDALGGGDPYSASKAMADILTQSWTSSFPAPPTAIARSGNVLGGGDNSAERLVPDLIRAFKAGQPASVRYPSAIRPWQHVLDCLNGYLLLTDALLKGQGNGAWNFGPPPETYRTVAEVANTASRLWGNDASWVEDDSNNPPEAAALTIDASKARQGLGWEQRLTFEEAITWVVDWERHALNCRTAERLLLEQLWDFQSLAHM